MLEIGIEEEFYLVEIENDYVMLSNSIEKILSNTPEKYSNFIGRELYQCMIELRTKKCFSIVELDYDLRLKRSVLSEITNKQNIQLLGIGVYPNEYINNLLLTEKRDYKIAAKNLPWAISKVCVCGQHVHIGLDRFSDAIKLTSSLRNYLPEFIAISTNSPFWNGRLSGLKTTRKKLFEILPNSGLPPIFTNFIEYKNYITSLENAQVIDNPGELRWDMRPNHKHQTFEFRALDVQNSVDTSISLAAFVQALACKIMRDTQTLNYYSQYLETLLAQNNWFAIRDGIQAKYYNAGKNMFEPISDRILTLIDSLEDIADELGSKEYLNLLYNVAASKSSAADKLIEKYKNTDLNNAIRDALIY